MTRHEVMVAAGVSDAEAGVHLRRLASGGLVEESDGRLRARTESLAVAARGAQEETRPREKFRTGDARLDALLRSHTQDGRLTSLPGTLQRRRDVLRHLALHSFEPSRRYTENEVNDVLRRWSERARTDHVALRRYLIELKLLDREASMYWLRDDIGADFHV
ncbi:DUF2087 domain-containing protein [Streptomyces sp. NPDC002324]